jgi:DNA-binding beta-propeller fold protein YncE
MNLGLVYVRFVKRWQERKMNRRILAVLLGLVASAVAFAAPNYQLVKKVAVPGPGGWDYVVVDEAGRRVYIAHSTQVDVLDADSLALVGTIPNVNGAHGIAIAPEVARGYATAGKADAVVPFDAKSLQAASQVKVGKKPDAIVYEPLTKRIYVMNGDGDSITALNGADGSTAGTIDLGGGPEYGVADGKGNFFVNLEDKNETLHIDVKSMKVIDRWALAPCGTPTALAMDMASKRLFVGCRSKHFAVLNAETGKVVFTAPIGERVDAGSFDSSSKLIFLSTGDGQVFIFHEDSPDQYSQAQVLTTVKGAKTSGFDPKTKRLFVPTSNNGAMEVLVYEPK